LSQSTKTSRDDDVAAAAGGGRDTAPSVRRMPESVEAEAAVLGSMIIDPACVGQLVQMIGMEAFYRPEHQAIFEGVVSLYERNSQIDLVLLRDELKRRNKLASAGGVNYLVEIVESVPSSANAEYYAEIVRDKAMLRELVRASNEILEEAYSEGGEVGEKLDEAEKKIFAVTEKKISGAAVPMRSLVSEVFENIEARKGVHITGLPTGYYELDEALCGLQKGEMIIIAGRPSMGKTSFAMNVAEHIGADNNVPVAIFSLEMSKHQLVERFLCSRGHLDSQLVRKGMLNTEQLQALTAVGSELFDKPIFVDDSPGLTPLMLRAKCRRLKAQQRIECVLIDYLQLMSLGGRVESRQQEISTISRYLKAMARELEVPVVVLSQLNRSPEGREGHRPRMSDLRESGSIEQDADVIMLLHREDYYHRGEPDHVDSNTADVIIAKQRNGPTGVVTLAFNGAYTRFENLSHAQEPF